MSTDHQLDVLVDSLATSDLGLTMVPDTDREHPNSRLAMYKNRGRNMTSSQGQRREALLAHQKKRRAAALEVARRLVDGDIERDSDTEEDMEAMDEDSIVRRYRVRASYKKQLMLSEWMEVVPMDLDTMWYIVPVPVGKRTLVVAGEGRTSRYTRGGYDLGHFQSLLGYNNKRTLLDCIFVPAQGTFYVLDVLVIKDHPLYDCDTVTRFEWGKQQIAEIHDGDNGIGTRTWGGRRANTYAFKPLEHYAADPATIGRVLSDQNNFCFAKFDDGQNDPAEQKDWQPAELDGILFYHHQLNYLPGHTPLVSWLKGYMVPEMLNIPVCEGLMAQKPANYEGMQAEVREFEKAYAQKKEKIKAKEGEREKRWQHKKRYSSHNEDRNFSNRMRQGGGGGGEFSRANHQQEAVNMAESAVSAETSANKV